LCRFFAFARKKPFYYLQLWAERGVVALARVRSDLSQSGETVLNEVLIESLTSLENVIWCVRASLPAKELQKPSWPAEPITRPVLSCC